MGNKHSQATGITEEDVKVAYSLAQNITINSINQINQSNNTNASSRTEATNELIYNDDVLLMGSDINVNQSTSAENVQLMSHQLDLLMDNNANATTKMLVSDMLGLTNNNDQSTDSSASFIDVKGTSSEAINSKAHEYFTQLENRYHQSSELFQNLVNNVSSLSTVVARNKIIYKKSFTAMDSKKNIDQVAEAKSKLITDIGNALCTHLKLMGENELVEEIRRIMSSDNKQNSSSGGTGEETSKVTDSIGEGVEDAIGAAGDAVNDSLKTLGETAGDVSNNIADILVRPAKILGIVLIIIVVLIILGVVVVKMISHALTPKQTVNVDNSST